MTTPRRARLLALLITAAFVALGSLWIAWPGLEYDEARFVMASYPRPDAPAAYTMHFHGRPVVLMVVSYMGALKGWLYIPILKAWPPSPALVRLPMVLVGAAGLYCFYLFTCRALGTTAALASLVLAATDPIYLFTTRLDWGPVAIQHFCLLGSCLAVLKWWQQQRARYLVLGYFLMGVGIFDKATFLWLLAALALATVAVFPRQLWSSLRPRTATVAVLAFLLGAAPFLYYCWKWPGETFRQPSSRREQYAYKLRGLQAALQGISLESWISREVEGPPLEPPGPLARAVYVLAARDPEAQTLLLPAVVLALLLLPGLPFHPWGRGMLFALLFCLAAFLPILLLRDAGAAHHLVLFFPFPQFLAGAALAGAKAVADRRLTGRRPSWAPAAALWLLILVLAGANLRVVACHYFRIVGYGGAAYWSEAIYSLRDALERRGSEKILLLDWGMMMQLRLLSGDRLPLAEATLSNQPPHLGANLEANLANPRVAFVKFAPGERPAFPKIAEAFFDFVARRGLRTEVVETIRDRRGSAIYEILMVRTP